MARILAATISSRSGRRLSLITQIARDASKQDLDCEIRPPTRPVAARRDTCPPGTCFDFQLRARRPNCANKWKKAAALIRKNVRIELDWPLPPPPPPTQPLRTRSVLAGRPVCGKLRAPSSALCSGAVVVARRVSSRRRYITFSRFKQSWPRARAGRNHRFGLHRSGRAKSDEPSRDVALGNTLGLRAGRRKTRGALLRLASGKQNVTRPYGERSRFNLICSRSSLAERDAQARKLAPQRQGRSVCAVAARLAKFNQRASETFGAS